MAACQRACSSTASGAPPQMQTRERRRGDVPALALDRGEEPREHRRHADEQRHALALDHVDRAQRLKRAVVITRPPASSGAMSVTVKPKRCAKGRTAKETVPASSSAASTVARARSRGGSGA